jgi:hypothetical protein
MVHAHNKVPYPIHVNGALILCTSSSSSAFALAWRNYSPSSITPPKFYERFSMPLRLGANWGYWPIDSIFDQGGVHHKLLRILTWMGSFACHWHRHHEAQGTSVLRLIRRTRAIEVKQLAQGCKQTWQCRESNPQPSDHGSKTLTTRPRRPSKIVQDTLDIYL